MNYLVLLGIVIIVLGFALRLDVVAVVIVASLVTGLLGGLGLTELLDLMGKGFINNRYMSLFILSLPVIGIMERYGLKEKARDAIQKIKMASAGSILYLYVLIRWLSALASIRLGGHVQFVRPLILPMAEGAAKAKYVNLTDKNFEDIKGIAGAVENYGNFFGQNIFPQSAGVLLILGTFKEAGFDVTRNEIAFWSIFTGLAMLVLALIQCYMLERSLRKLGDK